MEIDLSPYTPDVRTLDDMRTVLYDQDWAKKAANQNLYYMYRGVAKKDGLRYDITVIPAIKLGQEFSKTKGHVHVEAHQEVYTVLEGEAIYFMQKTDNETVKEVFAIHCKKGETIIIPSHYGHVTINPSTTEQLTMANWISPNCKSDYSLFEKLQGACYYYLESGWVKNPQYHNVPELRFQEPLKEIPKNLEFLKVA